MTVPDSRRLLDRLRDKIRLKHYSIRTEQANVDWIKRLIWFRGKRHPVELGPPEIEAFLTDLAVTRRVAASTQNQAKSAVLFLYKEVLGVELPWLDRIDKAKAPTRLPVVLTPEETLKVLAKLSVHALIGRLLYGTGRRIMECMRLRVKDLDFARHEILIRNGKGLKDRVTVLARAIAQPLIEQLTYAQALHRNDLAAGWGAVWLPCALARKYPQAGSEWAWQYVFPAGERSLDPRTGIVRRHHLSDQAFQRAMRQAVRDAGLTKPATPHTLRHSFATHLLGACRACSHVCVAGQTVMNARRSARRIAWPIRKPSNAAGAPFGPQPGGTGRFGCIPLLPAACSGVALRRGRRLGLPPKAPPSHTRQ